VTRAAKVAKVEKVEKAAEAKEKVAEAEVKEKKAKKKAEAKAKSKALTIRATQIPTPIIILAQMTTVHHLATQKKTHQMILIQVAA
jgi:hypothetical protein